MQAISRRIGTLFATVGAIASFLFALMGNVLAAVLPGPPLVWLAVIAVAAVVFWFISRWAIARWASDWDVGFDVPATLDDPAEQARNARRGLVLFVSKYAPLPGAPAKPDPDRAERIQAAIQSGNYRALDLLNSNLEPLIYAIRAHKSRLQHCWLISTSGDAGSWSILEALKNYLREVEEVTCEFHDDMKYRVAQTSDAIVYRQAYDIVRTIYRDADELYGLKPADIVADCTGGTKSMTLGAILASLGKQHDVELVGSKYGEDGRVTRGTLFTLLFRFSPNPPRTGY